MKREAWRVGAINLAVLALLALAALVALEGWLRLSIPPSSNESIYEYTPDTPRYKRMKADTAIVAWGKELRTNQLGFRDNASTVAPKAPGEYRIIVLGDSFTVSAGVDYRDIYTTRLQSELRKALPQVRVMNLAVGGYNIVQYALVLQEAALALQPDLLLVALFPDNDFSMETYDENHAVASGREPPPQAPGWPQSSYVYRAYGGRVVAKLGGLFGGPAARPGAQARRGWDENVKALRTIAHTARERGIRMEVALLPNTWHFERQRELFGRVEGLCRELKLSCVNLLEPFIAARIPESALRLNVLDSHPNERYNAFVAAQASAHLSRVLASAAPRLRKDVL